MKTRARAMLRIDAIMHALDGDDQKAVAFEVYRTYGSPVARLKNTRTRGVFLAAEHAETRDGTPHETPDETPATPDVFSLVSSSPIPPPDSRSSKSIRNRQLQEKAIEILEFLNAKTGRNYRPVEENLRFIRARLATCSVEDMKGVVARKTRQWNGTPQNVYLRPKTLFSATNFEQYIGEQPHA